MEDQSARAPKSKDRHQQRSINANPTKRGQNMLKYDSNQLLAPSELAKTDSSVNQVLNETNKIVKLGVQREFALLEKEKAIKDSSETIDNLRKNIIEIQMEYEKLDQNYQREISYRSELIKRTETTRGMVESAVHYSNILATSVKQLEDDKLKIAEFYSIIHKGQLDVEEKYKQAEILLKEQDDLIQKTIQCVNENQDKEILQAKETITQLNKKAAQLNSKLKSEMEQNQKISSEIAELKASNENLTKSLNEANVTNQKKAFNTAHYLKLKAAYKNLHQKKGNDEKLIKRKFKREKKALKDKMKGLEKVRDEILADNNNLKSEFDDMRSELEKLKNEANEFQAEKEEREKIIREIETERQKLQEEIQELNKTIENVKSDAGKAYSTLEENYQKILGDKENLESVVNDLNTERNNELGKLNEKIAELETELNAVTHKKIELESQILGNDEIVKRERLNNSEAMKAYERKIELLEVQINHLTDRELTFQSTINEKSAELNSVINELNMRDAALRELSGKMVDLDETKNSVGELNAALEKLKASNDALITDLEKLRKENQNMKDKLESEKTNCKTLKSDKSKLEKASKNLQEELENEKQSFENIKSDFDKIRKELYEAKKANEDGTRKDEIIAQLRKSLVETKGELEARKVVVKRLETEKEKEISDLKVELKLLRETKKKDEEFLKAEIENTRKNMAIQLDEKAAEIKQLQEEKEKLISKTPPKRPGEIENELEFSKPIIPERKTTAVTFANTTPATRKFLTQPRKLLSAHTESKNNPAAKKDVYEFDSDSSVEQYKPDEVLKAFQKLQKKEPASKKRKV